MTIADIHGVLPPLEAVLAEPDVRAAELIVVCGDLLAGPQPVETLRLLRSLGDKVLLVRGNADREMWQIAREGAEAPDTVSEWAAHQLNDEELDFLQGLPLTKELDIAGLGKTLFFHATPHDDAEVVLVDSRPQRWQDVFAEVDPSVRTLVSGHTHMPFTRLVDRRLVVNPGSIGMPYGHQAAPWAVLGPGVELRFTEFDAADARHRIATESRYPDAQDFADTYLSGAVSDFQALDVFGPMDGRKT